ncbi:MAG: translocation/assembly module TamB domain-containing protein, partial [Chromatiales bacterium]|nr:translocation/assembly module TamB domain-containing protein [Chromatiales bacterium]
LKAGEQQFVLDRLCLTQSSAQVCSSVSWQPERTLIDSAITQLPLTLLSRWLPEEAEIAGAIDATLTLEQAGEQLQGSAELLLDSGAVSMALEEPEKLELKLHQGVVKATFDQSTVQSELSLNIGDTGTLKGNAEIIQGESPETTRLSGHYNFQLPDLEPLRILIPDLVNLDGELTGDVTLAGTQAAPKIEGEVALTNATTAIPDLGVEFTDINLTVTSDDLNNARIEAAMKSGEGELSISGEVLLDPEQGLPAEIAIKGKDFLVVQLPESIAHISPDLNITFKEQRLQARGSVEIPKLDIKIKEIPAGSVAVSDDEIIVNQPQSEPDTPPLSVDANIDLKLGEAVSFQGFGMKTRIRGELALTSTEGKNSGHGELSLHEGRYKAYGQDLTMERGKFIFTGPLENPGIDLKATRRSIDDTVTAILNINGTLRSPTITISSDPLLPEEQALSYLVSGRSLQEEGPAKSALLRQAALSKGLEKSQALLDGIASGIGVDSLNIQEGSTLEESAVVLGKYLSPDLYISYGVGLFDSTTAFKLRYRLTKRLSVEAASGAQQSMDLIYQVEKD